MIRAKPKLSILLLLAIMATSILFLDSGCEESEKDSYERRVEEIEAAGSQFEEYIKLERESLGDLFWQSDGGRLYFPTVVPVRLEKITILRYYDRQTQKIVEVLRDRHGLTQYSVNECGDLVALASSLGQKDAVISIIDSTGKARFVELGGVNALLKPTWMPDCRTITFVGIRNKEAGIFSYSVDGGDIRLIHSSESDASTSITPRTKRYPQDASRGGIVLEYYLNERSKNDFQRIYCFGVLDVESGKVRETIRLAEFSKTRLEVDTLNWRYSAIEDAIYYFTLNEALQLESLWRIDSSGENLTKVLDGQDIGAPYWWHSLVSWSDDGKRFAFTAEDEEDCCERSKGIYLVHVSTKEITRLVPDADISAFAMSPDGTKIAYVSGQNALYILDIETKVSEEVYLIGSGPSSIPGT